MVLEQIAKIVPAANDPDVFKLLALRREISERHYSAKIAEGKRLRHLAEAEECRDRLRNEALTDHAELDLRGRLIAAEASAEHCEHNAQLYRLEVQAYLEQLTTAGDNGIYQRT